MAISYVFINQECSDDFPVVNRETEALVGSIDSTNFLVEIFDPDGFSRADGTDAISWELVEKFPGSGYYNISFVPDKFDDWLISVKHPIYFPWGKSESYTVVSEDFYFVGGDSTGVSNQDIMESLDDLFALFLTTL